MNIDVSAPAQDDTPQLQGKVLVVDDNNINQLVATSMLDALGLQHEVANNGEEAIALVEQHAFNLILMDIQMPIMGGLEATQRIRAMGYPQLPIYAMSANALPEHVQQAEEAGMTGYIKKPVEFDRLTPVLRQHLNLITTN